MRRPLRALLPAVLAAGVLGAAATAPASADVQWLCRPDMADSPCDIPLDTTVQEATGPDVVQRPTPGAREVDCFYVYPTVSNQLSPNATKARDPELDSIAQYQAARFTRHCRVFAPIYRQATIGSIIASTALPPDRKLAYDDVVEAFKAYLERDSDGRGFVLLGHSQGTSVLRNLLRRVVDPDPELRRRLVGAVLLGGNVTVAEGKVVGGDFAHVPLCTERAQIGCVVAYSTFFTDPPDGARFGRTPAPAAGNPLALPGGKGFEVACTDPRPLAGADGPLRLLLPSKPYAPGFIGLGTILTSSGAPPSASTTWVSPPDRAQGGCRYVNGAHVLRLDPVGPGSRRPNVFPEPSWGTHLLDMNLGLEELVSLVGQQADRYVRPQLTLTRRCLRGGRLRVGLGGRDAAFAGSARVTLGGRRATLRGGAGARVVRRGRARKVRAVVALEQGGPRRLVLERAVPRC
ncbi:DUF3089 domain-containing protein [Conexibacter sp. SYSU D00693]|uniref:DUF3089 domain-containing protein n=1 Tax=Conexibacter sp. SYSU D00693 TaxID=2812560 RepID=UPI00196B4AB5|nr:DUF3089 domain-containing protein [Conexibacter sp. SYSU D00693]